MISIVSGVLIFVIGQLIIVLFIQPIQELKKCLSDIVVHILTNTHNFSNLNSDKSIGLELKKLTANLIATTSKIPFYKFIYWVIKTPSEGVIFKINIDMIRLSNYMGGRSIDNVDIADRIVSNLSIFKKH
jgi:hypothetical protein